MLEIHRRTGYLLLATLVAQVILISAQVRTASGTRVLQSVTFGVFSQVQLGTAWVFGGVQSVWDGYFGLRWAHQENQQLRQELTQARMKLLEQHAQALRAAQLERILDLRERTPLRTAAATVIARDAIGLFQTVTIDKGSSSGLRKDMAVIAPTGVVGRIVEPPPLYAAKVQLLIDREAGAGAIVERSGVGGVVVGSDRDGEPPLDLQFISNLSDAKVGDRLVTSGLDGIFPRGITIGTLTKVEKGVGLYKRIGVTPAVDFGEVGAVLVVLDPPQTIGPSPTGGAPATATTSIRPGTPPARPVTPPAASGATAAPASPPAARPAEPRPVPPRPAPTRPTPAPAESTPPTPTQSPHVAVAGACAADAGSRARAPATGEASMKGATVGLAIIAALALQTSPFLGPNGAGIDLVLVVVVWTALQFGPAAGLLTGAAAGLSQDVLSAGIIGVSGFSKTLVGFGAGAVGSQFIVTNAPTRFVVLVIGAVVNELVFLGLYAAIEQRGFDMPWRQAGARALATAVVGIVLMIASNAIPAFLMRRRLRRGY